MSKNEKTAKEVVVVHRLIDAQDDGIALYGLLEAISSQYVNEGIMSIGALKHCITIVHRINSRVTTYIDQHNTEDLPF